MEKVKFKTLSVNWSSKSSWHYSMIKFLLKIHFSSKRSQIIFRLGQYLIPRGCGKWFVFLSSFSHNKNSSVRSPSMEFDMEPALRKPNDPLVCFFVFICITEPISPPIKNWYCYLAFWGSSCHLLSNPKWKFI